MRRIATPKRVVHKRGAGSRGAAETRERRFIKKQLINKQGAYCALCGKPLTRMEDITLDHIIPLSKGGTTIIDNCQLACLECNQKKADKWPDEDWT